MVFLLSEMHLNKNTASIVRTVHRDFFHLTGNKTVKNELASCNQLPNISRTLFGLCILVPKASFSCCLIYFLWIVLDTVLMHLLRLGSANRSVRNDMLPSAQRCHGHRSRARLQCVALSRRAQTAHHRSRSSSTRMSARKRTAVCARPSALS